MINVSMCGPFSLHKSTGQGLCPVVNVPLRDIQDVPRPYGGCFVRFTWLFYHFIMFYGPKYLEYV